MFPYTTKPAYGEYAPPLWRLESHSITSSFRLVVVPCRLFFLRTSNFILQCAVACLPTSEIFFLDAIILASQVFRSSRVLHTLCSGIMIRMCSADISSDISKLSHYKVFVGQTHLLGDSASPSPLLFLLGLHVHAQLH